MSEPGAARSRREGEYPLSLVRVHLALVLPLGLVHLAACSGSTQPIFPGARVERVELRPVQATPWPAEPTVVAAFRPDDRRPRAWCSAPEQATRKIDAGDHGGERDAWVMTGKGSKRVNVDGPLAAGSFNRVRVLTNPGDIESVAVVLQRKASVDLRTKRIRVGNQNAAYWIDFDLEGMRAHVEPFDRLLVKFEGRSSRVHVLEVQLVLVP